MVLPFIAAAGLVGLVESARLYRGESSVGELGRGEDGKYPEGTWQQTLDDALDKKIPVRDLFAKEERGDIRDTCWGEVADEFAELADLDAVSTELGKLYERRSVLLKEHGDAAKSKTEWEGCELLINTLKQRQQELMESPNEDAD